MIKFYIGITLAVLFIIFGAIFIYRLSNKVEIRIRNWFEEHERLKNSIKAAKNFLYNILIKIFWIWLIASFGIAIIDAASKYYSNFKTEHQKRLEFLQENCEKIDIGYEILNNGKSSYKCPNGKEYKE